MGPSSTLPVASMMLPRRIAGRDRRLSERFDCAPYATRQMAACLGQSLVPVRVRNISAGGISLVASRPVPPGTETFVGLHYLDRQFHAVLSLRVLYQVERPEGDYILGCAFSEELTDDEVEGLL